MPIDVVLPPVGEGVDSGEVVSLYVKEGDTVETKNGTMKVVLEKKLEMRTRVVTVPRTVTKTIETEDGPRTVVETVNTQVTQTYTVEVPVKKLLLGGDPARVVNRDSMANPAAFEAFVAYANERS